MKSINTLIIDIQHLLTQRGWVTEDLAKGFSGSVAESIKEQFEPRSGIGTLRLSRMGPQCPCALWHSIHHPELAEPLPPWAEFKYSFGHIIEAQAIMLAKASGHTVTGEQDELTLDGIVGHRDCVIDGCVVDVKSVTGMGFAGYRTKTQDELDTFGYLSQLDGYVVASRDDPLVTVKDRGYLLVIHKELGHMYLYEHKIREDHIRRRAREYKEIVSLHKPPRCTCRTDADGNSGNIKLVFPATYNSFKYNCFPNLRTFIYSKGPEYFVKVVKTPTYKGVPLQEVDKFGKVVYN